ncbi:PREDICTED: coiled-coil domain-containing protein 77-like [Branchiostoma belcheri]|uniref:Coiled-coil domain-containing protein 77-like n=1 Tax=Branchiostoma belcheri TaxID=7741 RepID=A0A6P4XTH2_BRABE|nr:PREDICTED: coiled-coil domain-containing protein 77-like [Branchiostoma belcheri]
MDVGIGEQDDEDRGVLKRAGITESMLEQDPCTLKRTAPSDFTNELVIELRKFHGTVSLRMVDQLKYLVPSELLPDISDCKDSSLRSRAETVWKEYQKLNRHTKKDRKEVLADFQNTPFSLPRTRTQSEPVPSTSATQSKLKQAQKDLKYFKRRCAQAERKNEELEERCEWLTQQCYSTISELHTNVEQFKKIIAEKSSHESEVSKDLAEVNKRNAELTTKVDNLQVRLKALEKTGTVRNVNKKLKR